MHLQECLLEHHQIQISYTKLTTLLNHNGIFSKRRHKKTRRKLELLEKSKNKVEIIQEKDLRVMIDSIPHPKKTTKKNSLMIRFKWMLLKITISEKNHIAPCN